MIGLISIRKKIIAISLPPNPEYAQYWLTIVLESKIKVSLHFNTQEEGERVIKELMSDER